MYDFCWFLKAFGFRVCQSGDWRSQVSVVSGPFTISRKLENGLPTKVSSGVYSLDRMLPCVITFSITKEE